MLRRLLARTERKPHRVTVAPSGPSFDVAPDLTVLEAALREGIAFPHSCRVGTCGTCRCRLQQGRVDELSDKAYALSGEEIDAGFILACQSLARSDLEIALPSDLSHEPLPEIIRTEGTITKLERMTHDILRMEVEVDRPVLYRAGQYCEIYVPGVVADGVRETRSYSFASAPGTEPAGRVDFHCRLVPGGAFTTWLHQEARVGQRLEGHGPYGDFWLRPSSAPVLCVAGGSGMAPIKALLEQARIDGVERDVTYFFGARRQEDLYCLSEMERLASAWPGRFDFVPVLSGEPEGSGWTGRRGFVSEAAREVFGAEIAGPHVYICGPPPMVDAARAVARDAGVSEEHLHFDKFLDRSHLLERG